MKNQTNLTFLLRTCALAFLLLAPLPVLRDAFGSTYWVDWNAGSDATGSGTQASPWKTLNRGVADLKPGDTLYVRSGTYQEWLNDCVPAGADWNFPVTVKHDGVGPKPVVQCPVSTGGDVICVDFHGYDTRYIVLEGLDFDATNGTGDAVGISAGAHHIRLKDCIVRNARGNGILTSGEYCEYIGLDVHHNGFPSKGPPGAHGLYLASDHTLVDGCILHENDSWGMQFWSSPRVLDDNVCRNTIAYGNSGGLCGRSNAMFFINCLVYDNAHAGIVLYGGSGNAAYNCTVYNNNGDEGMFINPGNTNAVVRNNLCYRNTSQAALNILNEGVGTVLSNNCTNNADPHFADLANRDFHLTASSAIAIDQGFAVGSVTRDIAGTPRPLGAAHDIGAYEFYGGPPTATNSSTTTTTTVTSTTLSGPPLRAWWKLDDGAGIYAADSSGHGNDAVLMHGPTWTTGPRAGALGFDGTNQWVDCFNAPFERLDFADGADLSIALWVRRDEDGANQYLIAKKNTMAADKAGYAVSLETDNKVHAYFSDGTNEYTLTSASTIAQGSGWRHVSVVFDDSSAAGCRIYVDGQDSTGARSGALGNVNSLVTTNPCWLARASNLDTYFDGALDDVRIYATALTPSKVAALYSGITTTTTSTTTTSTTTTTLPHWHPADMDHDWRMTISEVTSYGAAWKLGQTWPVPPYGIPIEYLTRGGYLWKSVETYHYDAAQPVPQCWACGE